MGASATNHMEPTARYTAIADLILPAIWMDIKKGIHGIDKWEYDSKTEICSTLHIKMQLLHKILSRRVDYCRRINAEACKPRSNEYWGWQPLFKDRHAHIGLITVYRDTPIPLHDHPNCRAASLVLEGQIEIERFTLVERFRQLTKSGKVELTPESREYLKANEITWIEPVIGNIHGMRAITNKCVLLKFQLDSPVKTYRSWYFPLCAIDDMRSTIQSRRIVSRYL